MSDPRSVCINKSVSRITVAGSARSSRPAFNFMNKRMQCRVIVEGVDVTPDDIVDTDFATFTDTFTHAAFDARTRKDDVLKVVKSKAKLQGDEVDMKVYATTINLDDIYIDHTLNTEEGTAPTDAILDRAPSAFGLPVFKVAMTYPSQAFIVLKETETCFLLELPTFCYDKGTQKANQIEEENEHYNYITVGKGRNRKTIIEETQTKTPITQSRHTMATKPQKKNAMAFASLWDMHDTYEQLAQFKPKEEPDEMVLYQSADAKYLRKKSMSSTDEKGKTFEELANSSHFFDAALLTERVLASEVYGDEQKKFRGLTRTDLLSPDLLYIYSMKPLWSFECPETVNRPVSGLSFNPKNNDIVAIAHGKFGYVEQLSGLVCIWCTKNPCKPERMYHFDDPVTSVTFSEKNANQLACGFANGNVLILDITYYHVKVMAKSKRETNPCFEPIWATCWRLLESETEYVMTCCQDGRINRFTSTKTHDFICTPMMRLSAVEGKLKGLETTKPCVKADVPITRHPAALCIKWHPTIDHIYLVGTDEGCIHKCSKHYLNQHMDVYRAHSGPVYDIQYSNFMNTLLATCGADGTIRLWMDGLDDVLMTLNCPAAVYGIAFCPINSTILISVSANVLSIWDLRRKTHVPCTEYSFPSNVKLTYVRFSDTGDNVFVGDTIGRVHTFHLEDTPIPPYYQRKMLEDAIKKALCTRPNLLKQLIKLNNMHLKRGVKL